MHTLENFKDKSGELGLFYKFLNDKLDLKVYLFYIRARKIIIQIKLGDNPRNETNLRDLKLATGE